MLTKIQDETSAPRTLSARARGSQVSRRRARR
jgi:hypothetical protein